MAIEEDEEILQDFLIEAEEILEQLNEQLIELEQTPQDSDLLNAVFRGFHTIKGGAGFLAITPLVEVCHRAEDVFNILRQGERQVDAQLMDVVLRVLDVVNDMFEDVKQGSEPSPADPEIMQGLESFLKPLVTAENDELTKSAPDKAETALEQEKVATEDKPEPTNSEDITEAEFDALLEDLHGSVDTPAKAAKSEDITDSEFDELLDELHGPVAKSGTQDSDVKIEEKKATRNTVANDSDDITEEEFDALLDQLHGASSPGMGQEKVFTSPASVENKAPPLDKGDAKPKEKGKKDAPASQAETTVRVDTKRLDDIMNLVGELVLVRNRLMVNEKLQDDEETSGIVGNLDLVTAGLQASVMKTRMQPIKKVFGRFTRVVRDMARNLNKEIKLELIGEETDLDKNLVEALADPLVHLVRNAVDHGIEDPDTREAAGKPRVGTVILSAAQEGDHILLTIDDDGAGMDPVRLKNIAVARGVMDEAAAARLEDNQAFHLIFAPGFSTKEEVTDISGRGVGMDVVKNKITQLNGSIVIDSTLGKGSRIAIKVPLTLAIMPTLMVVVGTQIFALPLVSVMEIFDFDLSNTSIVDKQLVVIVRNKALPIFYLRDWLLRGEHANNGNGSTGENDKDKIGHVVVVNVGTQQVGFVVDQLLGQEEVVIKPLGALLQGTKGLAGATITGNGRISLILDVPGLMSANVNRT